MNRRAVWFIAMFAAAIAVPAHAHQMHMFVAAEGGVLKGSAYFTGGAGAAGVPITVTDADGAVVRELQTDTQGEFVFEPPKVSDYTFVAETPDGHRASFEVAANEVEGVLAASGNSAGGGGEDVRISEQLSALREQVNALEQRLWLRDVIGGIGYIFGVLGLLALWKARRSAKP